MERARIFFRRHRHLAMLLFACALAMKAFMPAGFMLGTQSKVLTIEICADTLGTHVTKQIVVPHSGESGQSGDQAEKSGHCPYAGLTMAALAGADIVLLTAALAFILALGFAPLPRLAVLRLAYARPPQRGPPARI